MVFIGGVKRGREKRFPRAAANALDIPQEPVSLLRHPPACKGRSLGEY